MGLFNEQFERFYTRDGNIIMDLLRAANCGRTKHLPAIGLDHENNSVGARLKSGMQSGFAAQGFPIATKIENITGRCMGEKTGGMNFSRVQQWRFDFIIRWNAIGGRSEPAHLRKLRLAIAQREFRDFGRYRRG